MVYSWSWAELRSVTILKAVRLGFGRDRFQNFPGGSGISKRDEKQKLHRQ